MRMITGRALLAALALLPLTVPAEAQTLTIGVGGSVTSLDPHFYNAAPNSSVAAHLFDRLVERDPRARLSPGLAAEWSAIEPTVWEFKLRPGVKWHDGRDFTAEDVAFTIGRVPNVANSPGSFAGFVRAITRVEIVDPLTIRFHTAAPHPLLPTELASVFVISRHAAASGLTEDFNAGRAAVGTGPYRLISYASGDRTEFARNDGYWGGPQPWQRVSYRIMTNDGARSAAIMSGDVDVIDQVPSGDIPRLRRDPRIGIAQMQGLRMIYLSPDRSRSAAPPGVTDNNGQPLPANPFNDLRVRRALSMAIDREALADRVMEGTAVASGQWLPEGAFGYNPDVPPPRFDQQGARRLLAEAGFPQGFRLTLSSPNDRYPNDAKTAQAIAQMWTRVGVRTEVDALPWASYSARSSRQEFAMRLTGWGSSTGEASYALVNIMGTYDRERRTGASNGGRYSNPALDQLTARAVATIDDEAREMLLRQAVQMAMDDVALTPLYHLINTWAHRRSIHFEPRMDERTAAQSARPVH